MRVRESYGEEIEGLTEKVFGGDFDLVRTNWSFPENCEPILQTPRGPGFRPRMLAPAERCVSKTHFLSEPAEKSNLAGAGRKSWLGSASWR